MNDCDFKDAYIIKDDDKLMGKKLIKYLKEDKHVTINSHKYDSPKDCGYDANELDDEIWVDI